MCDRMEKSLITFAQYRRQCMAWGADYFFDKTYDYDRLSDAVRQVRDGIVSGDGAQA
jgi:hypothetical protein